MARKGQGSFTTVRSEGALLPPDFLRQIAEGRDRIPGLSAEAYHLPGTERLNEAASRSWNRLLGAWVAFQAASQDVPDAEPGTTITREKWLLPLFQELGYGRLLAAKGVEVEGKSYPISHVWLHTPIHLVGRNVDLDRRSPGVAGAARMSPHGLVQDLLNRSTGHLWGFVSNGLTLRILRNSKSLSRQAYVEFDLAEMMEGQVYADFALLWLLCHQSRVEAERPQECWIEQWAERTRQEGTRALDHLRDGVKTAIEALGRGFLAHPANRVLYEKLRSGALDKQDYYRQLLRTVYRLIFLFVAEERDLLLAAKPGSAERDRYRRYYSVDRLRMLAEHRRGSPHGDLWHGLRLIIETLSSEAGCPELGLPALGSYLWSSKATPDLDSCEIANLHLLESVRALAFIVEGGIRRAVDFKSLGPEELGSVYESLLELYPKLNGDAPSFALTTAAGHERKTTGSYYTPTSLIECLLDTALDPVLNEAAKKSDPAHAILHLKVCDPACGSGHFLIAAAHRMAYRLAAVRTGDEEPSPETVRTALRDVIGHCIYGVDVNPMAVELCKVNLWLEALEPGKPLSFLEHRIQYGNSLLGTTPALLKNGIPDEAFEPIEGDDRKSCQRFKKENKKERGGQLRLLEHKYEPWERLGNLATSIVELDAIPDNTLAGQRAKQKRWETLVGSNSYESGRLLADTWCAAFVWKKAPDPVLQYPITEDTFRRIEGNPHWIPGWMRDEVRRLAAEYSFFHWHLAFPDVFRAPSGEVRDGEQGPGWLGGFDVVLGNPPWERVKLQEKEFFAERRPDIAAARNSAARGKMIKALEREDPALHAAFGAALRRADGESALVRRSNHYPLCGRGDVNTFALFTELSFSIIGLLGRVGIIVPPGIATDSTYKEFIQELMKRRSVVSFFDFTNRGYIFPSTESTFAFALLTLCRERQEQCRMAAQLWSVADLSGNQERTFFISVESLERLNPNTLNFPIIRSAKDFVLVESFYRRHPVLVREGQPRLDPWESWFGAAFHMSNDSGRFVTEHDLEAGEQFLDGNRIVRDGLTFLPLYESKLAHQFNHRHATFKFGDRNPLKYGTRARTEIVPQCSLESPAYLPIPRYWVTEKDAHASLPAHWAHQWLLAYRRTINAVADSRSIVATILPLTGVGDSLFLLLPGKTPRHACALLGILNAFVFDYIGRQKASGGNLNYYVMKQLPVVEPARLEQPCSWLDGEPILEWVNRRILELTYTAWDLGPFAQDCGWPGPPFHWDEERRFLIRCELDAAFFHLYAPAEATGGWIRADGETAADMAALRVKFPTPREAVAHIMDTFPIVRRKDEEKCGEYRTKRVILDIYDRMQTAIDSGRPHETILDPPPADPRCCHPPRVG